MWNDPNPLLGALEDTTLCNEEFVGRWDGEEKEQKDKEI